MTLRTVLICSLCLIGPAAQAHGTHDHGTAMTPGNAAVRIVLPDIAVTDQLGQRDGLVSRYADQGPLIIAFLYTSCTDVCTMTRATLAEVDHLLKDPAAPSGTILTITVDPTRDTPEIMAAMAGEFDASPRWRWLRAEPAETPALLAAFGLRPGPIELHESVYLVGDLHSGDFIRLEGMRDPTELIGYLRQVK